MAQRADSRGYPSYSPLPFSRKNRVGGLARRWHSGFMNDYDRIARVIRHLDDRATEQPDLAALAHYAGLSPFHFHRLFSRWAGATPKDFLQCLTLSHARTLLREGNSVLDAALEVGLSGPARLHDLCVTLESATPGEVKSGGEEWTIHYGFAESPFGKCLLGEGPRGLCHLGFVEESEISGIESLRESWPRAILDRDDRAAARGVDRIFARSVPPSGLAPLRACVRGTAFQLRVWRALLAIPAGALASYGGLATALGQPKAARAIGSAVGRNPLGFLVPCHRVIRETGVVHNYRWGSTRKRAMLAWESAGRSVPT
jgi:AraC family transcriptional regulator of adaptative response/methylated-DNA-[protein]-cysteine methyltransferase